MEREVKLGLESVRCRLGGAEYVGLDMLNVQLVQTGLYDDGG